MEGYTHALDPPFPCSTTRNPTAADKTASVGERAPAARLTTPPGSPGPVLHHHQWPWRAAHPRDGSPRSLLQHRQWPPARHRESHGGGHGDLYRRAGFDRSGLPRLQHQPMGGHGHLLMLARLHPSTRLGSPKDSAASRPPPRHPHLAGDLHQVLIQRPPFGPALHLCSPSTSAASRPKQRRGAPCHKPSLAPAAWTRRQTAACAGGGECKWMSGGGARW